MSVQRVDRDYLELSDAFLRLGCAIDKLFPGQAESIRVVLPKHMHENLFGKSQGFHRVVVQGPYGQYRIEAAE